MLKDSLCDVIIPDSSIICRLSSSAKAGSVKSLVAALSLPGWFDVKLRVLKLLEENCAGD